MPTSTSSWRPPIRSAAGRAVAGRDEDEEDAAAAVEIEEEARAGVAVAVGLGAEPPEKKSSPKSSSAWWPTVAERAAGWLDEGATVGSAVTASSKPPMRSVLVDAG